MFYVIVIKIYNFNVNNMSVADSNTNITKNNDLRQWADSHEPLEQYLWIFYIMALVLILVVVAFFVLQLGQPKEGKDDSDSESDSDSGSSESDVPEMKKKIPKTITDPRINKPDSGKEE